MSAPITERELLEEILGRVPTLANPVPLEDWFRAKAIIREIESGCRTRRAMEVVAAIRMYRRTGQRRPRNV